MRSEAAHTAFVLFKLNFIPNIRTLSMALKKYGISQLAISTLIFLCNEASVTYGCVSDTCTKITLQVGICVL